jgi:hypothetical protein
MNGEILLDFEGALPIPPQVRVIENEVDFLRYATSGESLFIRGERLCMWAEDFYSLRGNTIRHVESPQAVLRRIYPSLSIEQAKEIADKIGKTMISTEDCTPSKLLTFCYPKDAKLWYSPPSAQHAAEWLVWLIEHMPTDAEKILLSHFLDALKSQCVELNLIPLYEINTLEHAKNFLLGWLGIDSPPYYWLGEFPLEKHYSSILYRLVKDEWQKRIIKTKGEFFTDRLNFPLSPNWRRELASMTAEFFLKNPAHLTVNSLGNLNNHLNEKTLQELGKVLPPTAPSLMPQDEAAVLTWFENEYLPYRRWQSNFGDETAHQNVIEHAQTFSHWLLERYPYWLLEGEWLSFQKAASLSKLTQDEIVLCIILDGLPAWDALDLAKNLTEKVPRLNLRNHIFCFAPIPSTTEFAKDALLKGAQPRYAKELLPLGEIIQDRASPKQVLIKAQVGKLWFWRLEQPDQTYHFISGDKRLSKVQAVLSTIVDEIKQIVSTVQETYKFRLIITSDHGRLLNPKSIRRLKVPEGMQAHGRVAWGEVPQIFPECGYILDENKEWVQLFHERYGLPTDLRIIWNEDSFLTMNNAGGDEAYPHGGLFPEEMIVPWFVFVRDFQIPQPEIVISGSGEAEISGDLQISIVNSSELTLECLEVSLSNGARVRERWQIAPLSEQSIKCSISPWPKKSELTNLKATLSFRQPNGIVFHCHVVPELIVDVLYDKDEGLLKDLEL